MFFSLEVFYTFFGKQILNIVNIRPTLYISQFFKECKIFNKDILTIMFVLFPHCASSTAVYNCSTQGPCLTNQLGPKPPDPATVHRIN